ELRRRGGDRDGDGPGGRRGDLLDQGREGRRLPRDRLPRLPGPVEEQRRRHHGSERRMRKLSHEEILAKVPQQRPFRFIDRIISVDEQRIVGEYTYRQDESFYEGH